MPDSLGFGSRQRPEHPRPASTRLPNNRQHAARAAPSLHPTRFLPNKSPPSIPRPHSQAALFPTSQLPTPRPGAPGNSQPSPTIRPQQSFLFGNPRNSPPMRLQAAPETRTSTHKPLSRPPSVRQSSECPAVFRAPGNPPNAPPPFPAKRSPASPLRHTRPPRNPEHLPASRNPQIPPGIPTPDSQPRHPETQKKQSRRNAGSAPNYLQVFTRSYLSRSESGSGSCSSPYC